MGERVYIFKGFERFWHWSQAGLIMFMMLTGFEIHGSYALFGFAKAVSYHSLAAWSLIGFISQDSTVRSPVRTKTSAGMPGLPPGMKLPF